MELIQVGEKTYYIKNATNIGIYKIDEKNIYLIDSGNDESAGKKIIEIIKEQGWNIKGIINTHSHADHIGGNKIIQNRTSCGIFAAEKEKSFIENPYLEPILLYGANPYSKLQNKFLCAKPSVVQNTIKYLPKELEVFSLKGHSIDMIGIKTSDNIYFLADALFSEETIEKYHIFYIFDVTSFLETLDFLSNLNGKLFIPSHGDEQKNITSLIKKNREKVMEIADKILKICSTPKTVEEIVKQLFDDYQLLMNDNQYVLLSSTIKSYLTYLYNEKKINYEYQNNYQVWKKEKQTNVLVS